MDLPIAKFPNIYWNSSRNYINNGRSRQCRQCFYTTIYSNQYVLVTGTSRTISSTTDKFNVVEFNSSNPITVTIPNDTQDAGWPVGSSVEIRQIGTGQISVTKDAAVTYYAPDSQFKSRVQWSSLFLEKRAANSWLVTGDATA
jgi:hypothetical protein